MFTWFSNPFLNFPNHKHGSFENKTLSIERENKSISIFIYIKYVLSNAVAIATHGYLIIYLLKLRKTKNSFPQSY